MPKYFIATPSTSAYVPYIKTTQGSTKNGDALLHRSSNNDSGGRIRINDGLRCSQCLTCSLSLSAASEKDLDADSKKQRIRDAVLRTSAVCSSAAVRNIFRSVTRLKQNRSCTIRKDAESYNQDEPCTTTDLAESSSYVSFRDTNTISRCPTISDSKKDLTNRIRDHDNTVPLLRDKLNEAQRLPYCPSLSTCTIQLPLHCLALFALFFAHTSLAIILSGAPDSYARLAILRFSLLLTVLVLSMPKNPFDAMATVF